jgi:hypothetical protein
LELRKIAAIYCLLVGISMFGMWSVFIASGSVPEFDERPAEIGLHLIAEFATALSLIIAGYGLLSKKSWGLNSYIFASGLLTYTLIVSPGYYVTRDEIALVVMFAIFLVIDIALLACMLRKR